MSGKKYHNESSRRNPFPDEPFFIVPLKLYDCGLATHLTPAQLTRYITFLRLANYRSRNDVRVTLPELERLDGICVRRAREIHPCLKDFGMILVEKWTRPYTYVVLHPSEWRDRYGIPFPPSRIPRSYLNDL